MYFNVVYLFKKLVLTFNLYRMNKKMKILCISDTHGKHTLIKLQDADMIIHAGDCTNQRDSILNGPELEAFFKWFSSLPYKYKIYIPGNHDTSFPKNYVQIPENIIVLSHREVEIEGVKIFGSPYTPEFGVGWAYNVDRSKIQRYWEQIPKDIDIIVTHGPAKGIMDLTFTKEGNLFQCGCKSLLNTIKDIKPKFHIFGHIHDESGIYNAGEFNVPKIGTTFVNASVVNLRMEIVNHGVLIEL